MGLTISRSSLPEIPNDLVSEILSRVPAKSMARFRCVSKQWSSILSFPYFTELYLTNSSARPRLLFTLHVDGRWLFFTSPQPLNLDKNSSPSLVADRHMCFPCSFEVSKVCPPVCGLICNKDTNLMICNPSTGKYVTLPDTTNESAEMKKTYFGYDPIKKQHKVLCVSIGARRHRVLTLEPGGRLLWRMVECSIPHDPQCVGICINGLLFYKAMGTRLMIVCFDVRSEKFKFISIENQGVWIQFLLRTLINYNDKLGALINDSDGMFNKRTTCIELWVLDDVDEQKWSRHLYILPPLWKNVVANDWLYIVGMTRNGEIVLTSFGLYDPFYIFYYNMKRNTIIRVKIHGIEAFKGRKIYTFIDHVEDVRLMDAIMAS
ncbi:F-box protein At3g49450 [Capsella rubella]|uniref:F-box protein At3g49450 n=1 Tax=Capsella rubella TaxID=81985 RepID=UPI000CD502A2|nr:F-box protein At3g49450 [Capsella rubella]